jgi:muramoyltetrapeptide carboxypeptidase
MIRPPRLRDGARVALVAPAGPVPEERIASALDRCHRLGVEAVPGRAVRSTHAGYLAGPDDDRLRDLRAALADPAIDAVWAVRGGYGTMRLLQRLDLGPMRSAPKPFIGFSDNTAVHLALHARGIISFHAPHAGGDSSEMSEACLRRVLWEDEAAGVLPAADLAPVPLRPGTAEGALVGGNLTLLAALCGTPAQLSARGCILFVEEIDERPYRIDRAWTQLVLAGVLEGIAGVALGHFTDCGSDVLELLERLVAPLRVPVLAQLPIGHERDNWTLPLGVRARLDADAGQLQLLEPAVS